MPFADSQLLPVSEVSVGLLLRNGAAAHGHNAVLDQREVVLADATFEDKNCALWASASCSRAAGPHQVFVAQEVQ